jgi:predicted ArsR family transcriptional regulator
VNTVRVHLNSLAEAGLVESDTTPAQGRGRPPLVYRAITEEAGEDGRRYRLLAQILTAMVARRGPDAAGELVEIGETWGRYLVESPPPYVSLTEDESVRRLVELLRDVGFEPRPESAEHGRRILMRPCPFLELARAHQDVICPIHLGLMRGALAELGASTTDATLEPFVRPDRCVATLGT